MLQIRLSNKATTSESGGGAKLPSGETVTVACPDHLVLAELPVAKSLGSANGVTLVKTVSRRSRRPLGERVHFCVQCDFPIAIYGRLIPCEHAFCLDCARSDSICYLCDERIQKIQTIKMMEGIFICAAPHCLKSFLKKTDFESHVHAIHADLLNPNNNNNTQKDGNDSEAASAKKPSASDSTVQAPTPRPVQAQDGEDRTQWAQPQPPLRPLSQYPMNNLQPHPNFIVPGQGPNSFGQQPLYGQPEGGGMEQGSSLGYPQPWNGAPFDPSMMMMNQAQAGGFFQASNANDSRGILAPPPQPLPPPFTQMPGGFFGEHGQGYGWQQQDKRDAFGNGQDKFS